MQPAAQDLDSPPKRVLVGLIQLERELSELARQLDRIEAEVRGALDEVSFDGRERAR